jgi:S1-C subfamily serine protease
MICRNRILAYTELSYVIAYQAFREALREASNPAAARRALVDEANALVIAINDECNIPKTGVLTAPPTEKNVHCIKAQFDRQRAQLVSRLTGPALGEGTLSPVVTVALQQGLQAKAYLPATAEVDGVLGPMSRDAIAAWQRDNSFPETRFGSKAMLEALSGLPQTSAASSSIPPSPPPPLAVSPAPPAPSFQADRSGKTSAIRLALADGPELRAQDVFEQVSAAVYVVKTPDTLGSAVAISDRSLLTNCHVMGSAPVAFLERDGMKLIAGLVSADPGADRCVLRIDLNAASLPKWVKVRPYADVKVGERVFTIGAPQGLELSLAEGIVSSKRAVDAGRLFQTSAPISSGSSGGGLFDSHGNLIGITTFMLKNSQNLNFAIAAEEYAK